MSVVASTTQLTRQSSGTATTTPKKSSNLVLFLIAGLLLFIAAGQIYLNLIYVRKIANIPKAIDPLLLRRNAYGEKTSEFEFPYPKTCHYEHPPKNANFDVALFYHVGMVKNWKRVVTDQLHTLETCGLGYMASSLIISYSNGAVEELKDILNKHKFTFRLNVSFIEATEIPWEKEAISSISHWCKNHNSKLSNTNQTAAAEKKLMVYYFHDKGVSKYGNDSWVKTCQPNVTMRSYCNAIHWRKYMEWFLIERPTLCLRAMLHHGALTCGVNLLGVTRIHYSGNFWAASCDWINTLPPIKKNEIPILNYIAAELWVGQGIGVTPMNFTKHVCFFNSFNIFPAGALIDHVILPEQYSNISEHKNGKYSFIWNEYLTSLEQYA